MKHLHELSNPEIRDIITKDPRHAKILEYEYHRGPFIQIPYKLLDNKKFLDEFFYTKRSRVYFFLRRHIVRAETMPLFLTYHIYYKRNLLATGLRIKRLCKKLDMPETTIRGHLHRLEKDGLIMVEQYDASETPDGIPHQVYILGVIKDGIERFFIDDVYLENIKPEVPDDD